MFKGCRHVFQKRFAVCNILQQPEKKLRSCLKNYLSHLFKGRLAMCNILKQEKKKEITNMFKGCLSHFFKFRYV